MMERSILFSAPGCLALLGGRKTQERRVTRRNWWGRLDSEDDRAQALTMCPYGQPGDQLWVGEAFRLDANFDAFRSAEALAHCTAHDHLPGVLHEASSAMQHGWGKLRSAAHMPRWASRIALEITGLRVEQVQDISRSDVLADGVEAHDDDGVTYYGPMDRGHSDPRIAFSLLWDSRHSRHSKHERCSWSDNPWVWVIQFRRVRPNGFGET